MFCYYCATTVPPVSETAHISVCYIMSTDWVQIVAKTVSPLREKVEYVV